MKKMEELTDMNSCINKAADDEPIFVLRANDPLAPTVIDYWANMAEGGDHEEWKIKEARELAQGMRRWKTDQKKEEVK